MRKKIAELSKKKHLIEWRSHEPSRLETFSDAVFAFAITLIIVSLEVPKTFDELYTTLQGTFCFAICFAVLFNIWHNQNIFFRQYGLSDIWTVTFNGMLMFVVLTYVYPLKFLVMLIFNNNSYQLNGHTHEMITLANAPLLMVIYGAGFAVIHLLFACMYINAKKQAAHLQLTLVEVFATETEIYMNLICCSIGIVAILLAWLLPANYSGLSGFFYFTLPFAYTIYLSYRGRRSRAKFGIVTEQLS